MLLTLTFLVPVEDRGAASRLFCSIEDCSLIAGACPAAVDWVVLGVFGAATGFEVVRTLLEPDFLLPGLEALRFKLDVEVSESEKVTCGDEVEAERGFKPDFSRCFAECFECWTVRMLKDASELEGEEFLDVSALFADPAGNAMGSIAGCAGGATL